MNCRECLKLLGEYHDDEITSVEMAAEIRRHLRECGRCAAELEVLKSEAALFERYRLSRDSEAAGLAGKWQILRDRMASQAAESAAPLRGREDMPAIAAEWLRLLLRSAVIRQAAFAAVLIILSVTATLLIVNRDREKNDVPAAARTAQGPSTAIGSREADSTGLVSAMKAVRRAEEEYIQAIQLLSEIVDRRMPTLEPALAEKVRLNLKAIDESIAATRKAYYDRPLDAELAQFMLAAYSKKVELLQQLAT